MKIYISTPAADGKKFKSGAVAKRVAVLKERLKEKFGYDAVSHLDSSTRDRFNRMVGGNVSLLLECDGIVLDVGRQGNQACMVDEAVARCMSQWKKPFVFFHTEEEFSVVKDKFIV